MSKYRVDTVEDLMNRVREHWDRLEEAPQDGFERTRAHQRSQPGQLTGPAHRTVDIARAYDHNLLASQYAQAEAFGRKPQRRVVVRSSDSAALQRRLPPQSAAGQAALPPPSQAGLDGLPRWARHEVRYEDAISMIEDRARAAATQLVQTMRLNALTQTMQQRGLSLADAAEHIRPSSGTAGGDLDAGGLQRGGDEDRYAPKTPHRTAPHPEDQVIIPPSFEATNPNFQWPDESFFESLAAGAYVVSGQGADFVDPEATRTIVMFGRPPVSAQG